MKTIVALVDLSDLASAVIAQAGRFAQAFGSEVVVLHVVPKEPVVVDVGLVSPLVMQDPSEDQLSSHYSKLLKMRDILVKSGVPAIARQLAGASPETVLAETRRLQAGLIVLGAHPHNALYHLLVGSMADDILKSASCPVLVVPESAQAWEGP